MSGGSKVHMIVTTAVRTRAILDLYSRQGIAPSDAMLLSDLRAAWAQVGLRHDDLVEGLRDLVFRNFIQVEFEDQQFRLRLTADGHDHAQRRPPDRDAIYAILDKARQRAAANAPEVPPANNRRYLDRQAAGPASS